MKYYIIAVDMSYGGQSKIWVIFPTQKNRYIMLFIINLFAIYDKIYQLCCWSRSTNIKHTRKKFTSNDIVIFRRPLNNIVQMKIYLCYSVDDAINSLIGLFIIGGQIRITVIDSLCGTGTREGSIKKDIRVYDRATKE